MLFFFFFPNCIHPHKLLHKQEAAWVEMFDSSSLREACVSHRESLQGFLCSSSLDSVLNAALISIRHSSFTDSLCLNEWEQAPQGTGHNTKSSGIPRSFGQCSQAHPGILGGSRSCTRWSWWFHSNSAHSVIPWFHRITWSDIFIPHIISFHQFTSILRTVSWIGANYSICKESHDIWTQSSKIHQCIWLVNCCCCVLSFPF